MDTPGWWRGLAVEVGGRDVVSPVGAAVLRLLADRVGLTGALSQALAGTRRAPLHDRGRVFTDIAVGIADGSTRIKDIRALRDQAELFGPVASVRSTHRPTVSAGRQARPGWVQNWTTEVRAVLGEAHEAVLAAKAAGRDSLEAGLRARYDTAVAFGRAHNKHRDWDGGGRHPGYKLARWLADYAEQVWLFTTVFDVAWTNNSSERAVKDPKRHQAVSGYWHTQQTLGRYCRTRSYLTSARSHA